MSTLINAISDTFHQISDASHGYNIEINQKIRERERREHDNTLCAHAAHQFLAHLARHCYDMSDEKKWQEISTMWDIWNLSTHEFNSMIASMLVNDGYEVTIQDGLDDGGIDIKGVK